MPAVYIAQQNLKLVGSESELQVGEKLVLYKPINCVDLVKRRHPQQLLNKKSNLLSP